MARNDAQTQASIAVQDTDVANVDEPHPHEPEITRQLDDEGSCLICSLVDSQEAHVGTLEALLGDRTTERDAWKDHKLSDPEAQAISACVKALDPISRGRDNYGVGQTTPKPSVARILTHLATRYGVQPEPHLQRLIDALTEALRLHQVEQPVWPTYPSQPLPNMPTNVPVTWQQPVSR